MKKCTFFGRRVHDGLMFSSNAEEKWAELSNGIKIDGQVNITIETITERNMKVMQQRRYYRGVVVHILSYFMGYTTDEMHQLLAEKFLAYTRTGKSGKQHKFIRSTAQGEIDTKEFSEFLEKCWALGDELKVRIPMPEEIEKTPDILKELYPHIFGKNLENPATMDDVQRILKIGKYESDTKISTGEDT